MSSVRQQDFIRRMPEASRDLRQRRSLWQVVHIDPILLILLITLTLTGMWIPVSYTHLRAHETVLDLVCRLLLEKKKNY